MKRLLGFLMFILVMYVVYYDLSQGTLPAIAEPTMVTTTTEETTISYFEKKVEHGDTVLSVIEKQLDQSIPVSIEKVVNDFIELNAGLKPEQIKFGQTYKFPNYSNE
ncbi:hypothetical protein SM124_04325 (plasmid) [Bacillus sp. 31A1R]|uniref:LysM domain-containing protein n=1 Tax=Robertmurraya mangrovi TaxID=3098077 RepID=A0ABU5IUZ3_9BACI|nr:hypothetical protein [Bacillus sp. 31A1R]MDZ5470974.1 hypothetical protein [Bacillus sp. 31A1R]